MENFVLIGNSTIKIYNQQLELTSNYTHEQISKCTRKLTQASLVFIASVVPKITDQIKNDLGTKIKEITYKDIKQIKIKTDHPENTGIDRILNCLAIFNPNLLENNVIVDCGTAMSISTISSNGDFLGGTISSGLSTENTALSQKTALLDESGKIKKLPRAIGKNTREAINNGILLGKIGAIKEIFLQIENELTQINPHPTRLILTGGWADIMSQNIKIPHKLQKKLTIRGLQKATA